jgi:hypothetical protein
MQGLEMFQLLTLAKTQLLYLSFRNIILSFSSLSAETTQVTKPQLEFSRERYAMCAKMTQTSAINNYSNKVILELFVKK